ncbi:MAG: hypothetical protein ABFD64_00585 [Armatimonadota bacterium]
MSKITRLARDNVNLDILDLFDKLARDAELSLTDESCSEEFVERIRVGFEATKSHEATLYGRRAESMFGYVAASLGQCSLIKKEDAGEIYVDDMDVLVPDYRIHLKDNKMFFVEVKNVHASSATFKWSCKAEIIEKLVKYAQIFNTECKIALYWSRWNHWMLFPIDKLHLNGQGKCEISFAEAAKASEMSILGDVMLGTTPPLSIRFQADQTKPRYVDNDGKCQFTISGIDLYCGSKLIRDSAECQLAFYLILFGDWPIGEPTAHIESSNLSYIELVAAPEKTVPNQGFEIIGSLSKIISSQYRNLTAEDKQLIRLSPSAQPGSLGIFIPASYKGIDLKLWQFHVTPSL